MPPPGRILGSRGGRASAIIGPVIDYSVTDPDVLADPAPAYARLRAECPVHRAEVDGRALYSISRAADVHRILVDPAHWSNAKGPGLSYSSSGAGDMQHDDPPEHTRRRKFARDWFGPTAVAELEPAIRDVTSELIETVRPVGRAELYGDVALPLPVTSFCAILGIDLDDRDRFLEWADEMVVSMAYPEKGRRARHELSAFTAAEIERRRRAADAGIDNPPGLLTHLAVDEYSADGAADAARRAGEHGQPAADRRPRDDHVADHQLHVAAARGRAAALAAGRRRSGADPQRRRGEPALRPAGARAVPHAERGHVDRRRRRGSRRQGHGAVRLGQPRRAPLPGPTGRLRRRPPAARDAQALLVQLGHPPLPRRPPRPAHGARRHRGAGGTAAEPAPRR